MYYLTVRYPTWTTPVMTLDSMEEVLSDLKYRMEDAEKYNHYITWTIEREEV